MDIDPLSIPHIVRKVMEYVPVKDVKRFRLVSQQWNLEALSLLQKREIIVLVSPESVIKYMNAVEEGHTLLHFKYEVLFEDFTGMLDKTLREFWSLVGPSVKFLSLGSTNLFWGDMFWVLERCPSLETLELQYLPRHPLRDDVDLSVGERFMSITSLRLHSMHVNEELAYRSLRDLLMVLPTLQCLFVLPFKDNPDLETRFSNTLCRVLCSPNLWLPYLRKLAPCINLSSPSAKTLAEKSFSFENLVISMDDTTAAMPVSKFLANKSFTLTTLSITFPPFFQNYASFFGWNSVTRRNESLFTHLKSLRVNGNANLHFVKHLPKLERLQLFCNDTNCAIPESSLQAGGHNLQSLSIHYLSKSLVSNSTVYQISEWFPRLTSIHLNYVDDSGLAIVYRHLPHLLEIYFNESMCTDSGITGVDAEICEDVVEQGTFDAVNSSKLRRDLYIGSLQFLRKLTIISEKLSDSSVYLGFADCRNLRELKVGSEKISATAIKFLANKLKLDRLDISYYPRPSIEYNERILSGISVNAVIENDTHEELKWTYVGDRVVVNLEAHNNVVLYKSPKVFAVDMGSIRAQNTATRNAVQGVRDARTVHRVLASNPKLLDGLETMGARGFWKRYANEMRLTVDEQVVPIPDFEQGEENVECISMPDLYIHQIRIHGLHLIDVYRYLEIFI